MDEDGGVCRSKGVSAARCQSCFPFESLVEEEEVILQRLQGLVLRDFTVPLGVVLGEVVLLEEKRVCDGGEKVFQKWEAGALRIFLAVPEPV